MSGRKEKRLAGLEGLLSEVAGVAGDKREEPVYRKWSSKKDSMNFLDDYERVKKGEMSLEEFRTKWMTKGDWKNYIRVMRSRIKRKFEEGKKDLLLIKDFLSLDEWP